MSLPMELYLRIEIGNDEMTTSDHLAEALRKVADRVQEKQYLEEGDINSLSRGIQDVNGNSVGEWGLR